MALGRALQLDEATTIGHHDVHVGLGLGVLGVVEIEHRRPFVQPDRHRRDLPVQRAAGQLAPRQQPRNGIRQRDVGTGDRRRARTAIGLQHVAIERDGAFAKRLEVDDRAQAAADQALDFERPATLLAARSLARRPGVRGARQHAVFGGDPALAAATLEARHAGLHGGGAEHLGMAELDQHRALGMAREMARKTHRAQLIGRTSARSHASSPVGRLTGGRRGSPLLWQTGARRWHGFSARSAGPRRTYCRCAGRRA